MTAARELHTERLKLRAWREADWTTFARFNADPDVMRYFPTRLSTEESNALAQRIQAHIEEHGWGLWAVEVPGVTQFAGFIGLAAPRFESHFTPCIEVGWRLGPEYWGRGYATEGGHAVLAFGFTELSLHEIVSLTSETNQPSRRVMERLGMTHHPGDDFDHPLLPSGHVLRRHVLYRMQRRSSRS
jgi:RimJ/RimL family protein N-acetyltransferase